MQFESWLHLIRTSRRCLHGALTLLDLLMLMAFWANPWPHTFDKRYVYVSTGQWTCTDPPPHEMLWQLLNMHAQGGSLQPGELAGGKSGKNLRYTLPSVRGDLIRYVSGREDECHNIDLCSEIADQMILKLRDMVSPAPACRGCSAASARAKRVRTSPRRDSWRADGPWRGRWTSGRARCSCAARSCEATSMDR